MNVLQIAKREVLDEPLEDNKCVTVKDGMIIHE